MQFELMPKTKSVCSCSENVVLVLTYMNAQLPWLHFQPMKDWSIIFSGNEIKQQQAQAGLIHYHTTVSRRFKQLHDLEERDQKSLLVYNVHYVL